MELKEFGELFSVIKESVSFTSEGGSNVTIASIGEKNALFELENVPEGFTATIDIQLNDDQLLLVLAMEIDSLFENWDQPTWTASNQPT
tara:strand:- start:223 stop:489 length:267 start_codon:yes stop_codon:yes gene_type:complete